MKQHDSHAPRPPPPPLQDLHPPALQAFNHVCASIRKNGRKVLVVKTKRIQPEQSVSRSTAAAKNAILINPKEIDVSVRLLGGREAALLEESWVINQDIPGPAELKIASRKRCVSAGQRCCKYVNNPDEYGFILTILI